jgi:hypothetical protein
MMRYFFGFLVTIFLIITLVILLFSGGGGKKTSLPVSASDLVGFASTDTQVRFTIQGPIVAESQRQEVQITVDRDNVTYEQIQGYDGNVVNTQTFSNTQNSYDYFLHALKYAGFNLGNTSSALKDSTGRCSTGQVYLYEVIENGDTVQHYWATSCGGLKTYQGNITVTQTLFRAQVPNYGDVSSAASL